MKLNEDNFTPIGSLILIKPLKEQFKTVKETVLDEDKNQGKNPLEDEMEVKEVKNKVKLNQQLATVLSIGNLDPERTPYKKGDTIVYDINSVRPFDLIKGTAFISNLNVIGIVKEA